tara:strand:+ start:10842 stop:11258 length:417 start_codon:yes stop_codon:yes gene_type:complete
MTLTYAEAAKDIGSLMLAVWTPTGHDIHWDDVRNQRNLSDDPWAVFVIRHASGTQDNLGGIGNRNFVRTGTAIASIFTPSGNGLSESYALAKVVADAYEGQSSDNGVWFRNVRLQEIGRESQFYQTNVLIDFEYNETK